MHAICDAECRKYRKIFKVVRYDNSINVRYICGPCDEKYQNRRLKASFKPMPRKAA